MMLYVHTLIIHNIETGLPYMYTPCTNISHYGKCNSLLLGTCTWFYKIRNIVKNDNNFKYCVVTKYLMLACKTASEEI